VAVKAQIETALKRRAMFDSHGVSVSVQGTEVTLSGRVSSWAEREVVQHTAWGTTGVRSVVDHTVVAV
jgi:osmotically-inducible protein OsmY